MLKEIEDIAYTEGVGNKRISTAPIKRLAKKQNINHPNDLWRAIGSEKISRNTVKAWWNEDEPMGRIDVKAWAIFSEYFQVDMLDLIEEIDLSTT